MKPITDEEALSAIVMTLGKEIRRLRNLLWCAQCGHTDFEKSPDVYCGHCVERMDHEVDALEDEVAKLKGEERTE